MKQKQIRELTAASVSRVLYECCMNDKQQPVMVAGDRCKGIAQCVNTFPLLHHP